jgi:hypothetical protein
MNHPSSEAIAQVPRLVRELYGIVGEFETLFHESKRKFTPDGHLVGSIGEVLAAHIYGLSLHPNSTQLHDAEAPDGRQVQVKATGGNKRVALRGKPDHLIVLQLSPEGTATEVFNGPGELVWQHCGSPHEANRQSPIALSTLRGLMKQVPDSQRVPRAA